MRFGSKVWYVGLLAVRLSPDFLNLETLKKIKIAKRNIKDGNGTEIVFEEIVDTNIRQAGAVINTVSKKSPKMNKSGPIRDQIGKLFKNRVKTNRTFISKGITWINMYPDDELIPVALDEVQLGSGLWFLG